MRIFLIILVLKLCNFHLFCCNGICSGDSWKLYLLHTEEETHTKLNYLFRSNIRQLTRRCRQLVQIHIESVDAYSLIDALTKYQDFESETITTGVIHLHAKDFYQTNYNDILERNFMFAGDIGTQKEIEVCRSVMPNKKNGTETCEKSIEIQSSAKLISKNLQKNPILFKSITNFDGIPLAIGICGTDKLPLVYSNFKHFFYPFKVEVKTERNETACEDLKTERMIALLTPKPFTPEEKLMTVTIFYDHLLTSPETKDLLPNSFPSVESTDKMKFAFLKFMQMMNWNRVAIISDDSLISTKFKQDLSSLFEEENVIFATKSCEISNCDFSEILNFLKKSDAKVIIANIGEEYAWKLAEQAVRLKMVKRGLVWIFRSDQASSAILAKVATQWEIGDIFSITLGPFVPQSYSCFIKQCNILASLLAVREVLMSNVIVPEQLTNVTYQKSIAARIRSVLYNGGHVNAYVSWYTSNGRRSQTPVLAAKMVILPYNTVDYQTLVHLPHFQSELDYCTFKSNVYSKPCSDEEAMYILLVVSVFALTLLGIVLFFQFSERSYTRMVC